MGSAGNSFTVPILIGFFQILNFCNILRYRYNQCNFDCIAFWILKPISIKLNTRKLKLENIYSYQRVKIVINTTPDYFDFKV